MGKYTLRGKIVEAFPLGVFVQKTQLMNDKMKIAFAVILYYTGVRVSELLRAEKTAFTITDTALIFNVGKRLKRGKETEPLSMPLELPFIEDVAKWIKHHRKGSLFSFNRVTAWRIIRDTYQAYPQYFRLNRITFFLREGMSIPEVMSWTGHKRMETLNAYMGVVSMERLSKSLLKK